MEELHAELHAAENELQGLLSQVEAKRGEVAAKRQLLQAASQREVAVAECAARVEEAKAARDLAVAAAAAGRARAILFGEAWPRVWTGEYLWLLHRGTSYIFGFCDLLFLI